MLKAKPVAVVFAADPYFAEDAADLVTLVIEPLAPVLDAAEQPGFYDHDHSTETTVIEKRRGDVEAAFRLAKHVVALDLSIGRHSGVPLETRGAIARFDRVDYSAGISTLPITWITPLLARTSVATIGAASAVVSVIDSGVWLIVIAWPDTVVTGAPNGICVDSTWPPST